MCVSTIIYHPSVGKNYLVSQDDPSKEEATMALEKAIKFPTYATLQDLADIEGDFKGE